MIMSVNYNTIAAKLANHDKDEVNRYINYLRFVESDKTRDGKSRNAWFAYVKEDQLIDIYNKVSIDGLSIDGETITIQYKGKLIVSYNYQAYKNKVMKVYPESKFDIQIVNEGDVFSFRKESGRVLYSHEITDPFNKKPEIIGTYCIIKNSRGEFLETLNMTEIAKMKKVATTQNIWNEWFSEMILKSVIKRACKRHFRDITSNIDRIDNDNYDLEKLKEPEIDHEKQELDELKRKCLSMFKPYKGADKKEIQTDWIDKNKINGLTKEYIESVIAKL